MNMNETIEKMVGEMRGVGPVVAEKLYNVGIDSLEKLKELGVEEAYVMMFERDQFCGVPHAAYLYSLYGAIHDCDWRKVPEDKKAEFKAFTKGMKDSM